jgi:hypothetical protein
MAPSGCSLLDFTVRHPRPQQVLALLRELGMEDDVTVQAGAAPALRARILTPAGVRTLGGDV